MGFLGSTGGGDSNSIEDPPIRKDIASHDVIVAHSRGAGANLKGSAFYTSTLNPSRLWAL
jgi:hypothetical protein